MICEKFKCTNIKQIDHSIDRLILINMFVDIIDGNSLFELSVTSSSLSIALRHNSDFTILVRLLCSVLDTRFSL